MNNELELNFIHYQLDANNSIKSVLQHEITTLLNLVGQKRDWLRQIEENNRQLQIRINSMSDKNKSIVKYSNNLN